MVKFSPRGQRPHRADALTQHSFSTFSLFTAGNFLVHILGARLRDGARRCRLQRSDGRQGSEAKPPWKLRLHGKQLWLARTCARAVFACCRPRGPYWPATVRVSGRVVSQVRARGCADEKGLRSQAETCTVLYQSHRPRLLLRPPAPRAERCWSGGWLAVEHSRAQ